MKKLLIAQEIVWAALIAVCIWGVMKTSGKPVQASTPLNAQSVESGTICLSRGETPVEEAHWMYIPSSPAELTTQLNLLYLAGQLIRNGAIDASTCPAGGLGVGGYANACGMALAQPTVFYLQNVYDDAILSAWNTVGVPPVLLKQMLRYESQFWPLQFGLYHFGLGHVTYNGAYTALRWSPVLYQKACDTAYNGNCDGQTIDDMMVGAYVNLMSAPCSTCPERIDVPKAQQSIYYLAHTLLAYCRQTAQIVSNAADFTTPGAVVDYPTIWKLTLYNYNAGPNCLYNAVNKAYLDNNRSRLGWNDIADVVDEDGYCAQGVTYVDNITAEFYDFPPQPRPPAAAG